MADDNPFVKFWNAGYRRIIPIVPPDAELAESGTIQAQSRGKVPGVRRLDGRWRGMQWLAYEAQEDDLARWHKMGAGVGVKLGRGLYAIDADTLDSGLAKDIMGLVERHLGELPLRVGNWPKALFLFKVEDWTEEAMRYCRVQFAGRNGKRERVEVLGEGRQFVAWGIHPVTRRPYEWPRGCQPYDRLSTVTVAQYRLFLKALQETLPAAERVSGGSSALVDPESLKGRLEDVRAAMAVLPNRTCDFPDREDYLEVGYALKGALLDDLDEALELYLQWCGRWEDPRGRVNDPEQVMSDWGRMSGAPRLGASWIYEKAEALGGFNAGAAMAAKFFKPVDEEIEDENVFDPPPTAHRILMKITSLVEEADRDLDDDALPLIKGLLDQGSLSVMYGNSGVGKTFVASDMACAIAAGQSWGGMKVERKPVLYIAAEGGRGARRRAKALRRKYGDVPGFKFLIYPIDLLRPEADLKGLIEAARLEGLDFGLVVVDTLSRAIAGGDENSSIDMMQFIKNVSVVQAALGNLAVLIIHHTGKDAARGARGFSGLRAALDTEIEIAPGEIKVTKQRELDTNYAAAFQLDVIELGKDRDGDPVTTCAVKLLPRGEREQGVASPKEALVREAVVACDEGKGATTKAVADYLEHADPDKMSYETIKTNLRRLAAKGLIKLIGRGQWSNCLSKDEFFVRVQEEVQANVFD